VSIPPTLEPEISANVARGSCQPMGVCSACIIERFGRRHASPRYLRAVIARN
jgi:hypothetical protein